MRTIGLLDWFRTERRSQEQTLDSSQLDTALRAALGGSAVTVRSVLNIPAVSGSVGFIAGTVASLPIRLYAAVRAKAKTELRGYAAGYVTNALEGGHVQTPGRYVPAMGKKLKANRVKGKYMYRKTAAELPQIAERGAQEIEKKAMAYLEGKG